jgi:hypothetical protein
MSQHSFRTLASDFPHPDAANYLFIEIRSETKGSGPYYVEVARFSGKAVKCNCPARKRCKHMDRAELKPDFLNARDKIMSAGVSKEVFEAKFAATIQTKCSELPAKDRRHAITAAIKAVIERAKELDKPAPKQCLCSRCGGSGWFPHLTHIEGGVCFRCRGSRTEPGSPSQMTLNSAGL